MTVLKSLQVFVAQHISLKRFQILDRFIFAIKFLKYIIKHSI